MTARLLIEVFQGLPSVVQASLIPGLVGWGRARELLYFGDTIDADVAHQWGFVNAVVEKEALDGKITEWEDRFSKTGQRALPDQKALMRVSISRLHYSPDTMLIVQAWEERGTGRPGVEAGVEAFGRAFETDEPRMLMEAFFTEKARRKKR